MTATLIPQVHKELIPYFRGKIYLILMTEIRHSSTLHGFVFVVAPTTYHIHAVHSINSFLHGTCH